MIDLMRRACALIGQHEFHARTAGNEETRRFHCDTIKTMHELLDALDYLGEELKVYGKAEADFARSTGRAPHLERGA